MPYYDEDDDRYYISNDYDGFFSGAYNSDSSEDPDEPEPTTTHDLDFGYDDDDVPEHVENGGLPVGVSWEDLSSSAQATLRQDIDDPVVSRAFVRFEQLFHGWNKVQEKINEVAVAFGLLDEDSVGNNIPDFARDIHEAIDPMSEVIWNDLQRHVSHIKEERKETKRKLNLVLATTFDDDATMEDIRNLIVNDD